MIKALFTSATGMKSQQQRIDVIANNLANVNTSGFKKSNVTFEDLLYSNFDAPGTQNADGTTRPTGLQIGGGSRLIGTAKVFTPGTLEQTGRNLDLVISGDGFFKLTDLAGNSVYTRDGNFHRDANGDIVTSGGLKLDPAITIPDGATVAVSADGTVTAKVGEQAATTVGRVTISTFPNPAGLESIGSNLLRETVASGPETPGNPGENGVGALISGFIERSNVDVVNELVSLITSQRAYEINSRAISAADEMLTTANNILT